MVPVLFALKLLKTSKEVGIITSILYADGKYSGALRVGLPARKSGQAISPTVNKKTRSIFLIWDGKTVFKLAVTRLPKVAEELLAKANMKIEDLNMVIPHQAKSENKRSFQGTDEYPARKNV